MNEIQLLIYAYVFGAGVCIVGGCSIFNRLISPKKEKRDPYKDEIEYYMERGYSYNDAKKIADVKFGNISSEDIVGTNTEEDVDNFNSKYLNENTARNKDYYKDMYNKTIAVDGKNLPYFSNEVTDVQVISSYVNVFKKYYIDQNTDSMIRELYDLLIYTNCSREERVRIIFECFDKYIKDEMELDPLIVRKNPKLVKLALQYKIPLNNLIDKLVFEISFPLTNIFYIRKNKETIEKVQGTQVNIDEVINKVEDDQKIEIGKAMEELNDLLMTLNNDLKINPDKFTIDI